jgi:hypothetical protein
VRFSSFLSTCEAGGEDQGEGGFDDRRYVEDTVLSGDHPLTQLRVRLDFVSPTLRNPLPHRVGEKKITANIPGGEERRETVVRKHTFVWRRE